jgi:hypothetical protein
MYATCCDVNARPNAVRRPSALSWSAIVGLDVGPMHRQAGQLPQVVVEVDAVLATRLTAID